MSTPRAARLTALLALALSCSDQPPPTSAAGSGGQAGALGTAGMGGGSSGLGGGGAPDSGGDVNSGGQSTASTFTLTCNETKLGGPLLRLLNHAEFERTVSDVFPQIKGQWSNVLPSDTASPFGFDNDAASTVGNQRARALLDSALSAATALVGSTLNATLPCAATSADRACMEEFLVRYGRRLFRRPLSSSEHDRYLAFFDSAKAKSDFKSALKWMTVGLIQSPNALYRREIGTVQSDGTRRLSPHEIATELAYTYTGTTPSEDLLNQADSGSLGEPSARARDLLAGDSEKQALQHFFETYLGYTRVASMQKPNIVNFSDLSRAMILETRAFIDDVLFQRGGGLRELLTAATTNPSMALASYYGFPTPSSDYAAVTRPSGRGLGILAQRRGRIPHRRRRAGHRLLRGCARFPGRHAVHV